ncbi:retinol dehydrogenase 12 isoform X2 [Apis cerana]|uniref:retinol dehydrogenase 12 isoform X2 n=1 Tax=Apis cerana TaxID=7461 RepID=UPI002B226696|nr:retinol dehydrogenase 12 isoform X2 [Apis cerana]
MRFFSNYCRSNNRLNGKTVVITGANCGIGKETARDLYKRGGRVILACRDINKAKEAVNDIKENVSKTQENNLEEELGELEICHLNLNNLANIKKCAQHLLSTESNIHILINNAGVFLHPFEKTKDGFETHFQVNHLGHFLLTLLLLPKIEESGPGCRIINVSSVAHKSAGIQNINVYSLHPGVVKTELNRYLDASYFRGARLISSLINPLMKTSEQGAQTTIYCAVDENAGKESGLYYDNCRVVNPSMKACDPELANQLWKYSCELLGLLSDIGLKELSKIITKKEIK